MIKKCSNCGNNPHTQDEIHGKGRRVFNEIKGPLYRELRCTVCGKSERTDLKNKVVTF